MATINYRPSPLSPYHHLFDVTNPATARLLAAGLYGPSLPPAPHLPGSLASTGNKANIR